MTERQDNFHDWDAAYVLGALNPDDRRAFEQHLVHCPVCSASVAELAGMPGLLGKLPVADAVALAHQTGDATGDTITGLPDDHLRAEEHEPGLVQRLAASVRAGRRRTRRRMTAILSVGAAVLLGGGILLGTAIVPVATDRSGPVAGPVASPDATGSPTKDTVSLVALRPGTMTADLRVTERSWGTRFDWNCDYQGADYSATGAGVADTIRYSMVVTDAAGAETRVASWAAAGESAGGLVASSSVPRDDIRTVEIRLEESNVPLMRATL